MKTPRSYCRALLASRGVTDISNYDVLDTEIFVIVEEIKNTQQYLSALASLPSVKAEEMAKALKEAYYPYSVVDKNTLSAEAKAEMDDFVSKVYTIRRGPSGQTLEIKPK